MFKVLLLFVSIVLFLSSCSQEDNKLLLDVESKEEVIEKEKNKGGELLYDSLIISNLNVPETYRGKVDKELKFLRNSKATLPLKTRYFYKAEENTVKVVLYQWDRILPGFTLEQTDSLLNMDANNMELYDAKFNEVGEQLIDRFGLPNKGHGSLKQVKFKMLDMWQRQLIWDLDTEYAELNLYWVPKTGYRIFKVFVVYYKK